MLLIILMINDSKYKVFKNIIKVKNIQFNCTMDSKQVDQQIQVDQSWISTSFDRIFDYQLLTCPICYSIPLSRIAQCKGCNRIFCQTDNQAIITNDNICPMCRFTPFSDKNQKKIHLLYRSIFQKIKFQCRICSPLIESQNQQDHQSQGQKSQKNQQVQQNKDEKHIIQQKRQKTQQSKEYKRQQKKREDSIKQEKDQSKQEKDQSKQYNQKQQENEKKQQNQIIQQNLTKQQYETAQQNQKKQNNQKKQENQKQQANQRQQKKKTQQLDNSKQGRKIMQDDKHKQKKKTQQDNGKNQDQKRIPQNDKCFKINKKQLIVQKPKIYTKNELFDHLKEAHKQSILGFKLLYDFEFNLKHQGLITLNMYQNVELNNILIKLQQKGKLYQKIDFKVNNKNYIIDLAKSRVYEERQSRNHGVFIKKASKSLQKDHTYTVWQILLDQGFALYGEQKQTQLQQNYKNYVNNIRLNQFMFDLKQQRYRIQFKEMLQVNTFTKFKRTIQRRQIVFK